MEARASAGIIETLNGMGRYEALKGVVAVNAFMRA